jgi:hypothetical protein
MKIYRKFQVHVKRGKDMKWRVEIVNGDYNHEAILDNSALPQHIIAAMTALENKILYLY